MERKSAILLSIMLVVGSLAILPMSGSGAVPHLFQAYDEATSTPMINNNTTFMVHPNDGLARMYNFDAAPGEVAGRIFPDPAYPGTSDIVGMNGSSMWNNSFHLDTAGFDTDWTAGDTFVFTVEKDTNFNITPPWIYDVGDEPMGFVASTSLAITVDDFQVVGPMTLEKIPIPSFISTDLVNYTVNWTDMGNPLIGTYIIYNSTLATGSWNVVEEVAAPPSTVYADSGKFYSIGINWTGGVWSLVQSEPNQFNTVPVLSWTGEPGYGSDGVSPDSGPVNCRDFEFRIEYSDPNSDPPGSLPVLHILENGVLMYNLTMEFDSWVGVANDWAEGAIYVNITQLTNPTATYSYYFSGDDIFGTPAIGDGTVETPGPSVADNVAPSVDVLIPNGGQVWTGGANKTIMISITDEDTVLPGFNMSLTLKYSTDHGVSFPNIIDTLTNKPSILSMYYWDPLPTINSDQVRVRAEFTDSCGVAGSDDSDASFEIDSTPPTVTNIVPADGATDVAVDTTVVITFSEEMNTTSVEAAITFEELVSGTPVPYIDPPSWNSPTNTILTLTPISDLSQYTDYTVSIAVTALDISDPGNPLDAFTSTFKAEDLEDPVIVHDPVGDQETGATVTVTAEVTDNVGVDTVTLSWGYLGETPSVVAMSPGTGNNFSVNIGPLPKEGFIQYTISATDPSGNSATTSTNQFEVVTSDCWTSGGVIDTDTNLIEGARVEVLDGATVLGSTTTNILGIFLLPDLPCGQYTLKVTADGYADHEQTIDTAVDTNILVTLEPSFPLWIIILIIVIIIVVILLLLLLLKRRKKPEEEVEGEEAPEEEEAPAEEMEEAEEEVLEEGAEDELAELEEVLEEAEEKK